jgi:hypothetical protein
MHKNKIVYFLGLCALLVSSRTPLASQETSGTLQGTVTEASGASIANVEIVATNDRVPNGLKAKSDALGYYTISGVPIGPTVLTFTAPGFTKLKQSVEVRLGTTTFSPRLEIGAVNQVVEVVDTIESLNTQSSTTETVIQHKEIDNLAKGRTFQSLLALSPGVRAEVKGGSAGVGGIQVDGASGLENTYYLDGVEVSDPISGALRRSNAVPFDFIQEIQVRTGGFNAEYGGATGGVVTVGIRGGTNSYHGEGNFQYTGDGLNARDRAYYQRSPLSAAVADFFAPKKDNYSLWYPGGIIGGRIIPNKLFFWAGYEPELEHTDRTIAYAAGARTFSQDYKRENFAGRLDYSATSKIQLYSSYLWSPIKHTGNLPNRDPRVAAPSNNLAIQGGYLPSQAITFGGTYAINSRLTFAARYGYKYLNDKDGNYGIPGDAYVVYQTASSQAGLPVPTPGGTGFSNVSSTLTTYRDITTRKNLYLDLGYIQNLFGQQHNFKFGYAFNRVGNDVLTDYPNGDFNIYWGQPFSRANISNVTGAYGYYTWEDGVRLNSKVNGRNQGLYVQDEWRFNRRLTLNIGVRLENEYLPPYRAEQGGVKIANPVSFNWGDKVAPRLGFAYDVLGDGKWKVSGSMGIFYDVLKYNLARGSFGGEFWVTHVYQLNSPNVLNLTKANAGLLGPEITSYDNRTVPINAQGELDGIDSDLKPYTSRNFNFALDHKLTSQLTASVRYVRKDLLKTIEDIGVLDSTGNEVYLIGNPGFGQTRNDPTHTYDGKTPNGQEYLVPKAVRQYNAVEFRLQGQIGKLFLAPSYTWSRLYGNYSGLGNSDESGRSNPDNNRSFDLPYYYFDASGSQKNVFGLLGTDRTHAFNLYTSYNYKNKLGSTIFGLVQVAESGTPDSTSIIYLSAPTYPYGRGDLGRTPFYTQTDIQVSHTFSLAEKVKVRLEANVQNLFNQDAIQSRVSQYNRSGAISATALPLSQFFAGYDPKQFISSGVPFNPIYGLPGSSYRAGGGPGSTFSSAFSAALPGFEAYQSGRVFRLGMRVQF